MASLAYEIDWTECDLVEQVPGKVSGEPIVRGTRIMPGPVVRSFDRGENIEQIREDWPSLSADQIKALVASPTFSAANPSREGSLTLESDPFFTYSEKTMEVLLTPEQEAQLTHLATRNGTDAERLVKDAILHLLEGEPQSHTPAPELPSFHLGDMKSLHRRDIYDDVREPGI